MVIWNPDVTVGPTGTAVIRAGTDTLLDIKRNGTAGVRIGTTNNLSNGAGSIIGTGNSSLEIDPTSWDMLMQGTQVLHGDNAGLYVYNNKTFNIYNGAGTDVRWTHDIAKIRGDASTPGDGASADSPTYGLRIYNDPVGAPALESFDSTWQYVVLAGGGTADVDTEYKLTLRGAAALGVVHDEGENACKLRLPTVNVASMPVTNGCIVYDGAAFYKGVGGVWVAF